MHSSAIQHAHVVPAILSWWTPARIETLKGLLPTGLSCTQIGAEMGTSRNAVIGKLHRLGLRTLNNQGDNKKSTAAEKVKRIRAPRRTAVAQGHTPRIRIIASNGNSTGQRLIHSTESPHVLNLRCVEIDPFNVVLLDLQPHHCRYPYGEGSDITFCGHGPLYQQIIYFDKRGKPVTKTSSYCKAHHFLCVGPGTYSEQRATVVAKDLVA
jgi:hypothetical protein